MRTLEGKATILFCSSGGLSIEIADRLSGTPIRVELSSSEAIAALSRVANVDCTIIYPDSLEYVGMDCQRDRKLINKTWEGYKPTEDEVDAQCEKEGLLTDGWYVWSYGLTTQQNTVGKHEVILERYVEAIGSDGDV